MMLGTNIPLQGIFDLSTHPHRQKQMNRAEGNRFAARQSEGLFIELMLKSMRSASPAIGLLDNNAVRLFTALFDQQVAQHMASRETLGVSSLVEKQLQDSELSTLQAEDRINTGTLLHTELQIAKHVNRALRSQVSVEPAVSLCSESRSFVAQMLQPARYASRQSGIPYSLIIAQAALESGWGKKEIMTAEGKPSHNIFGIKVGSMWNGSQARVYTKEFLQGGMKKVIADFKVYPSYFSAFKDYANLLNRDTRYRGVVAASSAEEAALEMQKSGYATDPEYANKLIKILGVVNKILGI